MKEKTDETKRYDDDQIASKDEEYRAMLDKSINKSGLKEEEKSIIEKPEKEEDPHEGFVKDDGEPEK